MTQTCLRTEKEGLIVDGQEGAAKEKNLEVALLQFGFFRKFPLFILVFRIQRV